MWLFGRALVARFPDVHGLAVHQMLFRFTCFAPSAIPFFTSSVGSCSKVGVFSVHLRSRMTSGKVSCLHLRSTCRIVRRSRMWLSLFLRSWRSACRIVRRSRLWISLCLRSWRRFWPSTPQERVQNRTQEQIMDFPVPQITEAVFAFYTTGARAESHAGADYGFSCASEHGR